MSGPFDFLPEDLAYYANIAVEQIEKYPTSSLNAIRSFADLAARLIAKQHSIAITEPGRTPPRFRETNEVYQDIKSHLDPSGRKFFTHVFKHANPSSHGQSGITGLISEIRPEAEEAIKLAEPFARWLQANYAYRDPRVPFQAPSFRAVAAAIGLLFFAWVVVGALRGPPPRTEHSTWSPPPVASPSLPRPPGRPTITQIQIGRALTGPNSLQSQGDRFTGPVNSLATIVSYTNAISSQTKLKVVLAVSSKLFPCEEKLAFYEASVITCSWNQDIPPGEHSIYAYADTNSMGRRFTVIAPPGAAPSPAPPAPTGPRVPPVTTGVPPSAPLDLAPPKKPVLTELRRIQIAVAPYIPQHIIFDDADQMLIPEHRGVAVLLDGQIIDACSSGGRALAATRHGMYTFDSCGTTRASLEVVKYVKR